MICFHIVKAKIVGFGSGSMQNSQIRIRKDQERNGEEHVYELWANTHSAVAKFIQ
jgi:hypothetical protein